MLEIGSLVGGKYKILNVVGHGGMSVVYLAMNEKANKQWAIKEVRKDGIKDFEVVKQGLVVETDMLKKLSHPSLPSIIDVIEDDDTFLIVMDYIQGNPLSRTLEENGAQSQENVIGWARQLCDVLGYLHTRDPAIIYRDMKPANIMLKPDGNVTLIDFGTAREFKERNLADTTCLGTVGYAAPEQFGGMGQTDARTDIYCLGATLYHLVTGLNPSEPPYEMKPIREINPSLSGGLEKIILKCTQRDPDDRYQSAAELMYELGNIEKTDVIYRNKQKTKLGIFILAFVMTLISGSVSAWGYSKAQTAKMENYEYILTTAGTEADYYSAIVTDPGRPEAYLKLVKYLTADMELTKEEASALRKLLGGIDVEDSRGYMTTVDVLAQLKTSDPDGYEQVCYSIGEAYLFNYNIAVEKDRYASAAEWFEKSKDKFPISQIYCDISVCLNNIYQYGNAKVKQTTKLYDEYGSLWNSIAELKLKSDSFVDYDSRLQVWNLVVDMISGNVNDFLEVTSAEELTDMLDSIEKAAEGVTLTVLEKDIKELQVAVSTAKAKIRSVRKQEAGDDV